MKQFFVLTLFPEMIEQTLSHSIMGRAQKDGHISVEAVNIRDFTLNKHKHVDDYPYGGGAGLVMQGQPIYDAYQSLMPRAEGARVVFMTPQGRPFTQRIAEELAQEENLVFLCGHYEGIDERLIEEIVTDEISLWTTRRILSVRKNGYTIRFSVSRNSTLCSSIIWMI